MVAGIIVAAAADQQVLSHPGARAHGATGWMVVGGPVSFLAGHALYKRVLWGVISWTRLAAIAVLLLLLIPAPHVTALTLGLLVLAVLIAVAATDRLALASGSAD